ncbi:MAG: hypothetical protein ACLPXB_18700 [Thiobacillaceae bacterium]
MGALLGAPWLIGSLGIALSPLLVLLVISRTRFLNRWGCALGYYLVGAAGLPGGAATFFGSGHVFFGYVLWLTSAALLALPWAWVTNGWRAVWVMVLSALPPLGVIGWLSPLTAAGIWFPGKGWIGLFLSLVLVWALGNKKHLGLIVLGVISMITNLNYRPAKPPTGWIGVDTHVGPQPENAMAQYERLNALVRQVHQQVQDSKVVMLPEAVAADWWEGTRFMIGQAVPTRQIWLVGASITDSQGTWDAIGLARHGEVSPEPVFKAVLPVPFSMWKPWSSDTYTAAWWPSVNMIAGVRTMAMICYDQLLVWPWLETLWQQPEIIIAPSNGWWAGHGSIPTIQAASIRAWGRLMGVGVIEARNR